MLMSIQYSCITHYFPSHFLTRRRKVAVIQHLISDITHAADAAMTWQSERDLVLATVEMSNVLIGSRILFKFSADFIHCFVQLYVWCPVKGTTNNWALSLENFPVSRASAASYYRSSEASPHVSSNSCRRTVWRHWLALLTCFTLCRCQYFDVRR